MYFTSRKDLDTLLQVADTYHAADVHLGPGRPPMLRGHGELFPIKEYTKELTAADMDMLLEFASRTPTGPSTVQSLEDMDFAYIPAMSTSVDSDIPSVYRVNAGMTIEGIRMVFRRLPALPPTIHDIQAPDPYVNILNTQRQGLVLVTGPTGSGKSTTLAAMINYINENHPAHILTIEDPIEFVHQSKKALVNQRELHEHTHSFANALKSALREDPDVILVGEMRDPETIGLALTAAETGHLVFGTLHTTGAAKTVDRIVDVFPAGEKEMVRSMLSESLRAVISQTLLKTKDGSGRVAAHEIMLSTPAVRNLIRENKIAQISSVMQTGQQYGMQTLDQCLQNLVRRNQISVDMARSKASNPDLIN